ncbi:MAG: hypothetical protein WD397_16090 [Wenzhouxiangellaceae bacterium]
MDTTDGGGVEIDGNCSLTEALVSSNFNAGVDDCNAGASGNDVIAFETAIFSGSPFFAATISLEQSLDISDGGVTLEPPVDRTLIIQSAGANRLFTVSGGDSVFRRVTLNGGSSTGDGGAILINAPADNASLQLENVIGNNSTADGIGGFLGGDVGTGIFNLNIFSSSFSANTSNAFTTTDDISGGVIGIDVPRSFGFLNVLIDDSTFSANNATNSRGGVIALFTSALEGASFGLTITNSIFNDNAAGESGGAIFLDEERSQNGYFATLRNNRFSMNSAARAGAIFAKHAPVTGASSDSLVLARNSFVGNDAVLRAGAVEIIFIDTVVRNNLFALNTSETVGSGNPGALRIEHDGASGSTISDGGVDIRANTFFENDGNPHDILLDMPLTGAGAAGPSRFDANVTQGLPGTGTNCQINNFPNGNFSATNIGNECTVGGSSVVDASLGVSLQMVTHPVHTYAAIPELSSPVVDLWFEPNCNKSVGEGPLENDMLGERRDPVSGLPPDGDGDMSADCDAGSIELDQAFALEVTLLGAGAGSVQSDVSGIGCPGDCSESYSEDTMVELFATEASGSTFTGWGGDCGGTGGCIVTMDQARSVTASFEPVGETLTVALDGNGTGRVTSSPAGIDCPGTCSAEFPNGSIVDLNASPDPGSAFLNWSGDCAGDSCQLTLDQPRSVSAVFGDGDLLFLDGFE